jgi:chromosome segregation ATPase
MDASDGNATMNTFSLVRRGYDPGEVDERLEELSRQLADSEARAAAFENELIRTADMAAQLILQLDSERDRAADLENRLNRAREQEDAVRLMLDQASKTRDKFLAEAEFTLENARDAAASEAAQIAEQAMKKASKIVAEARREGAQIVEAGRGQLAAMEDDARSRLSDLEEQHSELRERLRQLHDAYGDLTATLREFADTSLQELDTAQDAIEAMGLGMGDSTSELGEIGPRNGGGARTASLSLLPSTQPTDPPGVAER